MVNCPKLWPICTWAAQELCFSVLSLHNMAQKTGRGGRAVKSVCQIQVDALSKTQVWIPLWMFVINFITSMFWIFPLGDLGTHICVVLLTLCPIIVHGIVLGNTSPQPLCAFHNYIEKWASGKELSLQTYQACVLHLMQFNCCGQICKFVLGC